MFSFFEDKKEVLFDPPVAFETVVHLVQVYGIPIHETMLYDFGKSERLQDDAIELILKKERRKASGLDQKAFREWCLEKIVFILIKAYKIIDESLYKILVNLVNGLSLKYSFLDKAIRKSKELVNLNN